MSYAKAMQGYIAVPVSDGVDLGRDCVSNEMMAEALEVK